MKTNHLLLTGLMLLATGALQAAEGDFDRWAEKMAAQRVRADPEEATYTQYFSGDQQDALDRLLTPNTKAHRAQRIAAARKALAELGQFDRSKLTPQQRISAGVIEWSLRGTVESEPFEDFYFVFNQFTGLHTGLVKFLTNSHPIRNPRDIENYLARLEQVAGRIDEGVARAKDAESRGFLMPQFITTASLGQFDRFLEGGADKNILVTSLEERAAKLADVTAEQRATFVAEARKLVGESVIPAYQRAQAMLKEQLPNTTDDAGLWRLPGGEAAYAQALHRFTTTHYTPDQVHQIGLKEVARIEKEMDGLLIQLGYKQGDIESRMDKLNADTQPKEADPRAAMLERYESLVRDAERRAKAVFDITPKAPVIVKREPAFTEKNAAAHYTGPSKDGSRPGIFWAPLPGPRFNVTGMRTLVYHEAVPGHHFQIALQRETESLPRYRREGIFTGGSAFSEGWALYAEQIAAESDWYEGDLQGRLGQLGAELFRARRLVADTGLHTMKWTRKQTIDYGIGVSETERYVSMPGQACAYKIGMLKILDLRAKARKSLGAKFNIKQFHNVILRTGNVPLPVLETAIGDWIDSAK